MTCPDCQSEMAHIGTTAKGEHYECVNCERVTTVVDNHGTAKPKALGMSPPRYGP